MVVRQVWARLRTDIKAMTDRMERHRTTLAAGGLAYFVALSIAPAAVVVGRIAGFVIDPARVRQVMDDLIARSPDQASTLAPLADSLAKVIVQSSSTTFTIATVVSILVAVYGASRMVYGLRLALGAAFQTPPRYPGLGERLAATVITLLGVIAVVLVLIALTVVPRILDGLGLSTRSLIAVPYLDWVIVAILLWTFVHLVIARGAHHRMSVPWWAPGPFIAAGWILVSTLAVGLYLRFSASLGVAVVIFGSAVVALLWLYLAFLGLLFGAEMEAERQERLRRRGAVQPAEGALTGEPAGRSGDQRGDEGSGRGSDPG